MLATSFSAILVHAASWPHRGTKPRFMAQPEAFNEPQARGFTWCFKRYGLMLSHLEERFVNGFVYQSLRPVPEAEIPERFGNAARALEMKLWRADLRQWDEDGTWLAMWRAFLGELDARGRLRWENTFIDGSFASAKKGALTSDAPPAARVRSGLWWSTARVFLSEFMSPRPVRPKSRSWTPH